MRGGIEGSGSTPATCRGSGRHSWQPVEKPFPAVILSVYSRRPLSVMSETERIAKWVCPLPRGEGGPRRRFHQPSRAG